MTPEHALGINPTRADFLERLLRKRLSRQMAKLLECAVQIDDFFGSQLFGQPAAVETETLRARIEVRDPAFYRLLAARGSVGAGAAYIDGLWRCDDLVSLVRVMVRNRPLLDAMDSGTARYASYLLRFANLFRRNTRRGSRRNIAAHYDLGNDFFRLFLDRKLMYSSAIYRDASDTLEDAATRKLARICEKLQLRSTDHVIEIGSGWGGFALFAAQNYGCRVTTTTISEEQFQLATARVHEAGLADRITVLKRDYRDLDGQFDKLVSIEMVEAIGHQYLDRYFTTLSRLLKPDGMALIQAITIEDYRYRKALVAVDFIKRYVFPGSFMPSVSALLAAMARRSDFKMINLEDIGPSYALTLKAWRERFLARLPEVRAQGYDERFIRLWEFYLCYCEGAFLERAIGNAQMLLSKPRCRRPQYLPDLATSV